MCASFTDKFDDIFCFSNPNNVKPGNALTHARIARHLSSLKSIGLTVREIFL